MDILAHSLWGLIIFKLLLFPDLNPYLLVIFSIIPDLVAFVPLIIQMIYNKSLNFKRARAENENTWKKRKMPSYVSEIYNWTHSLIVVGTIFIVLFFIKKEYSFYILPWILHIIVDIPSHERDFFGTPILYPISDFKFDGIPWSNKWHMIINYSLIIIVGSIALFA